MIPVFNGEKFIRDCFASIVGQTIFKQLEVIFINDASTDNTLEILKECAAPYNNIIILNNTVNLRPGGARNVGIKKSTGKYIGFFDADDIIAPDYYETLYSQITKHDADAVYVGYSPISETEKYESMSFAPARKDVELYDFCKDDRATFLISPIGNIWSGLYKKEVITSRNVSFPNNHRYEDNYWVSLMKCYFDRVVVCKEYKGYFYRSNSNSITHMYNSYELIDERIEIEKMLYKEFISRELYEQYKDALDYLFIKRYAFGTFVSYLRMFSTIPYGKIHELREEFESLFPDWKSNKYLTNSKLSDHVIAYLFDINDSTLYARILYKIVWRYYKTRKVIQK